MGSFLKELAEEGNCKIGFAKKLQYKPNKAVRNRGRQEYR